MLRVWCDARAGRVRFVLRVNVSAVVHESLGRVGLAVERRQVQRGVILRVKNEPPRGLRTPLAGGAAAVWS
jgi:hypothetical protein